MHAHLHQVFSTTTPVPLGDGGGSRTEANVALYNAAARAVLPPAVIINDLHGDIVAFCGEPSSSWLCAGWPPPPVVVVLQDSNAVLTAFEYAAMKATSDVE